MKNTESNISNQALSFISSESKSSAILMKCLTSKGQSGRDLFPLFYAYTRVVKKHRNKYVNKKTLSEISTDVSCERLQEIVRSPAYSTKLPIEEYCRLVRILLHYFLCNASHLAIFASRKLATKTYFEHLKRRRQVQDHLERESRQLRLWFPRLGLIASHLLIFKIFQWIS